MTFSSADDLATNNKEKKYKNISVRHLMWSTLILTASEKIEEQWFRTFEDGTKLKWWILLSMTSMSIFRPFIILN